MPSPITITLLAYGAVLTALSATAGAIVAGVGLAFEIALGILAGQEP